jgi:hypothetical protein
MNPSCECGLPVSLHFILDVETPAGGAEIGTGAAVETRKGHLFPERGVKQLVGDLVSSIDPWEHGRPSFYAPAPSDLLPLEGASSAGFTARFFQERFPFFGECFCQETILQIKEQHIQSRFR